MAITVVTTAHHLHVAGTALPSCKRGLRRRYQGFTVGTQRAGLRGVNRMPGVTWLVWRPWRGLFRLLPGTNPPFSCGSAAAPSLPVTPPGFPSTSRSSPCTSGAARPGTEWGGEGSSVRLFLPSTGYLWGPSSLRISLESHDSLESLRLCSPTFWLSQA